MTSKRTYRDKRDEGIDESNVYSFALGMKDMALFFKSFAEAVDYFENRFGHNV